MHGPVNEGKKGKGASAAYLTAAEDSTSGIMLKGNDGGDVANVDRTVCLAEINRLSFI